MQWRNWVELQPNLVLDTFNFHGQRLRARIGKNKVRQPVSTVCRKFKT